MLAVPSWQSPPAARIAARLGSNRGDLQMFNPTFSAENRFEPHGGSACGGTTGSGLSAVNSGVFQSFINNACEKMGGEMRASECFKWREGVVWPSVRWAAAPVVSCSRRVGSDTSSGCLAQQRGPFSSDQRQEAKVKSEGKRTYHPQVRALCALAEDKRNKERKIQRCRDNHRTRNTRTVECLWSMSSLLEECGSD